MLHLIASVLLTAATADIEWQADYESALERAQTEGKIVFVALHGPSDARCQEFAKRLYRDKSVNAAAAATVNVGATTDELERRKHPFVKGLDGLENRRLAASLRESLVQANREGVVATPQHLWLSPNGEILLSVPYEMERDELVWCFHEAQRLLDPAAAPAPESARPPCRLLYRHGYTPHNSDELARGLTQKELEEKLDEVRASMTGRRGWGGRVRSLLQIAFTDERDALAYTEIELGNGLLTWSGNGLLVQSLHVVGVLSPAPYWKILDDFVTHDDADVRREAAVALEQLGAEDGLKSARRGLSKEKEDFLRGAWLRAVGACARGDKSARKILLEAAREESDTKARASAIFALGYLEQHEDVRAFLIGAVRGERELEASMAACAMALSRDRAYEAVLSRILGEDPPAEGEAAADGGDGEVGPPDPADEPDEPEIPGGASAVLSDALAVLRGADLARVGSHVSRATGAVARRERVFFENGGVRGRIDGGGRGR